MMLCCPVTAARAQSAGKVAEVRGALLARQGAGWQTLQAGAAVPKDVTLVALFESDLISANGAVNVKMLGDIGDFGPLPALESSIRVHDPDDADLALTLETGIVVLTNKKQAPAKATLKVRGEPVTVTLKSPGTKIGIEVYGRHPGGAVAVLKDEPTTFVIAVVVEGSAEVASAKHRISLSAPPGPAVFRWDSVTRELDIVNLQKLPPELVRTDKDKARLAELCAAAENLGQDQGKARALLMSTSSHGRRVGVTALGALDDVQGVLAALGNEQHQDVREQAILVLRHWLGQSPGQVKTLRGAMLKSKQFNLLQGKVLMQLLFGFDEEERVRPGVKELLVVLLDHPSNVGLRELAHWHLVRIEPKGQQIPYDAAGPGREAAVTRWRQLLGTDAAGTDDKNDAKK
jgi:hypothetical protein